MKTEFDHWYQSPLPDPWPSPTIADTAMPTIQSSGDICDLLSDAMPEMMILCADLEAPTNHKRRRHAFTADDRSGSYVHCGVREHLMGAMANGIAAHGGLRVANVTYFAFSDYERAAMRMAALMRLPVLYIFSHDSIGVGSNGPTHQPIETLASFRAMPNMRVFRPADSTETFEAWQIALETRDGPSLLALSRQPAQQVRSDKSRNRSRGGAYVLSEASQARELTLIATGTEVALAVEAQRVLESQGVPSAVVSMPCWDVFAEHSPETRASVIGNAPRLGIEAASSFGWSRWLRPDDSFIGIDTFGASATSAVLYNHFGLTVQAIVRCAKHMHQD